jgi:two-component system copper resistance phosphate regulon response regulator CusR
MKILVIEDESKISSYLKKGLEEEGFAVDVAVDGEEGLSLALHYDYDLIILDVMLPRRDGWSVMQELRQSGKKTLVLFLTARDHVDDRVRGLDLGADAYLVKPFAFSELTAQMRSLLRRNSDRQYQTQIKVGDLVIDPIRHIATRGGVKLDLTPKEFALLSLLALRRGEILTRAVISEKIWNLHFDPGSNSVDVHIRRLRTKVDDPWEVKMIKTIRGIGYSIEEKP